MAYNRGGLRFDVVELEVPDADAFRGAGVAIADLDGDGDDDLAISTVGPGSAAVWLNEAGELVHHETLAASDAPCAVNFSPLVVHVDDDDRLDLVVSSWTPATVDPPGTDVWINDGGGDFTLRDRAGAEDLLGDHARATMGWGVLEPTGTSARTCSCPPTGIAPPSNRGGPRATTSSTAPSPTPTGWAWR